MKKNKSIAAERCTSESWLPPWTVKEHHERYQFAAGYVKGKDVVDCACGSGESSHIFLNAGANRVIGIDVDTVAIEKARFKFQKKGLEFHVGNGREIPLQESTADVFVCLETIEHVKDDTLFIEEAYRVLRPGGFLICSTPNREVTNPGTLLEDKPWNHFHLREYNEVEFEQLFHRRFAIVSRFGQNPVHPMIFSISQLITKTLGVKMAVKFNQVVKCRWFLFSSNESHHVQKPSLAMEYFVWVLKK